jgi:hypothetical protein
MTLQAREIPSGILVFDDARCVAGIGWNAYRPWLYPLYTPAGRQVLQEFPFDHPFHNGCFVGQNPVLAGGGRANFWEVFTAGGRIEVESLTFPLLKCVWRDAKGEPVLEEERIFTIELGERETVCEVSSRKIAAYADLDFPPSKFGGIGVRVDPQLLPVAGARINGKHEERSSFVAYENDRFGLALLCDGAHPWFVREYGLALYNPTWKAGIRLRKGEALETRLKLVAYDGALPSWIASSR